MFDITLRSNHQHFGHKTIKLKKFETLRQDHAEVIARDLQENMYIIHLNFMVEKISD